MRLQDLRDELLEIGMPVYHYSASKQQPKYIVWAEEGQSDAGYADNKMTVQVIQGTIDYFTKDEYDGNFNLIQSKLNELDIAWRLNSTQHEEKTGYIHYEWLFEFVSEV